MSAALAALEYAQTLLEVAAAASPAPEPASEAPASDPALSVEGALVRTLISAGPVGVFFLAVLFKKGIMTVSEHRTAVEAWDREREAWNRERDNLIKDADELKDALRQANEVYTTQVIPTLTRVLDAERELVDLRREEQSERRRRVGD